jgi:hypothetical protein
MSRVPGRAANRDDPRRDAPLAPAQATGDPFRVLGLPARADLTDQDVHAAWRRIASATHPDREDGGDPPRFADAAAAYTLLRTRFSRGEALADLSAPAAARAGRRGRVTARRQLAGRVLHGRPGRLALRILAAAAVGAGAVAAAGPHPAAPALVAGVATWLVVTARNDLAPAPPPAGHSHAGRAGREDQDPAVPGITGPAEPSSGRGGRL